MIHTVAETGSTNADLIARLRAGERVPEGAWLVADRQVAGRGRQGRTWFDGTGNFMGSTVVHAHASDPAAHTLALVTGLAVYEAVQPYCPNPAALMLKWPNDVLLGDAKLCGILLEREGDTVVIGIGVNLAAAPDLPDRETIALSSGGPAPDRDAFATSLASSLATELERWRTYGLEPIIRRWQAVGTPIGTPLSVHEPDGATISGQFAGLDSEGSMQLRLADGSVRAIHAGDVMLA
ncbi:biotin--[acetyl-CoA-carboxylase] ligase [Parerythrobacter jejuensis]|uniref:biotin--[biotin carboxyl-carrier protein] ligase n=1 Tax=Parerythrobacter jejuensis TaxID=795812 RepID=A0A845ASJ6_9SPHN|nr:biotin--[acetyl-CoA-carboxylase] ligase [Parerythrobacter jejuensis]MXP32449.1 biotin--[acetyl-CoA-carboxylase] ligase [Parerythrobacter jejuensis]